ncbi:FAD/NAD(P)-binding domain-containing protein [Athelia psychrophila]|uniref:FAD/NAD(P)-binding domain-containing protein n=1 Tax=Athelia psychrophila TaxID=1759441 RepID=A0A167V4S0_9AGAM|nr:FAD/NAD(P)-binding domain-containing protein [Fibularhizoctonia sp. CBS 109695]
MKIAVVGSGVSGLAATWLLNEYSDHEVHLYEADSRTGGHANTVRFTPPGKTPEEGVDVDTGFIVFNPSTYPNFLRFLQLHPEVPILNTEMTFSVSRDNGLFEWAGDNLSTIFIQPQRLLDPNHWRLIYDVLRFNACARRLLVGWSLEKDGDAGFGELSIGEYLEREGYSDAFRDNYLIPMTAAIWSTPPDKCAMDFPARTLIQFLSNHHLLQITGKPSWLTIKGGSRVYVDAILGKLPPGRLHLAAPVASLISHADGTVVLTTAAGAIDVFDHVVLATHSATALAILRAGGGATPREEAVLGGFKWTQNTAVLHCDAAGGLMPRRRGAWSCWNYMTTSTGGKANADRMALTYGMNDLQHIPEAQYGPVLVTLNPPVEPAPEKTMGRWAYEHPVLDAEALRCQKALPGIQNTRGISYAGAWARYGFHEDGFTAGLAAALTHARLPGASVRPPFGIEYAERAPGQVVVAGAFEWLEGSGWRARLGAWAGLVLAVVRWVVGFGVDLGLIEGEIRARARREAVEGGKKSV